MRVFASLIVCCAAIATRCLAATTVDGTVERQFTVEPAGDLVIESGLGSIDVRTGESGKVLVVVKRTAKADKEARAQAILQAHELGFDQDGSHVRVTGKLNKDAAFKKGSWFGRGESLEVRYIVTIPAQFHLDLATAAGSILVPDLEGKVKVKTSGGNLELGKIRGPVDAVTAAGSIVLGGASEDVTATTSGGNISAGDLGSAARLQTAAGSIRVKSAAAKLAAKTSGGNIDAGQLGSEADLETAAGSISIGTAKGRLNAETSGGNIRIEDARETVNAHTSAGSINASFTAQPTGDCRLTTSGGSIDVRLASNLGFELDAATSGGDVKTDFPITMTVTEAPRTGVLKGKLNEGGKVLQLKTSAGSIRIRR
jgi:DUF4097 and DUF4098 domain-containing protein YvlB